MFNNSINYWILLFIIISLACISTSYKKTIILDSFPDKNGEYWDKKISDLYNKEENILNLYIIPDLIYELKYKYPNIYTKKSNEFKELSKDCKLKTDYTIEYIPEYGFDRICHKSSEDFYSNRLNIYRNIDFNTLSEENLYTLIKISGFYYNIAIKSYCILKNKFPSSKYILLVENRKEKLIPEIFETGEYYYNKVKNYYAAKSFFKMIVDTDITNSFYFIKSKKYLKYCKMKLKEKPIIFNNDKKYLKNIVILGRSKTHEYVILRETIWYGNNPGNEYQGVKQIKKTIKRLNSLKFLKSAFYSEEWDNNLLTLIIIIEELLI